MLRSTASRRISRFNFGQPDLYSGFGKSLYVTPTVKNPTAPLQSTRLPNGATVVTQDIAGAVSTVGVFAEAGAKFDPAYAPGLSHLMRYSLLASNFNNSTFQIDRAMRSVGAGYSNTEVNKRLIGWTATCPRGSWASPLEHLLTCVAAPRFAESDIERYRDFVDNVVEERRWQQPRDYVVDQLESVAFFNESLGRPRFVPPYANDSITKEKLLNHYCSYFTPSRITVVGVNVEHDALIAGYSAAPFQHSASAPHHANAKELKLLPQDELAQYTGGREAFEQEKREKEMTTKPHMEKETIAALGWPTYGSQGPVALYAASLVLRELLNVGFQDGINHQRHDSHLGIRTFYRAFSTAGLIGVTIRDKPEKVYDALKKLKDLNADLKNLSYAKARAETAFYHENLDQQKDFVNFIAGSTHSADSIVHAIRDVSERQVTAAYELAKGNEPVLFATGDTLKLPSVRQLLRK